VDNRGKFSSNLGVLAATLGSAVGLGNIWKFPYMTGENGGAAFIIIYLICVALASLPVMLSEFVIGRRTNSNPVGAYKKLKPGSMWFLVGFAGIASSLLIMFFYTGVAGWVLSYIFKSISGAFINTNPENTIVVFQNFITDSFSPLIWQWIVLVIVTAIIIAGVEKGIERITKTLMPILLILLIFCDIRALTLPGAMKGVEFIFSPDFSKVNGGVILAALGLAFFKLSVGMGTMTTYGSYFKNDQDMPKTAVRVAVSDVIISILAGLAIFPAVFAFGFQPDAGPGLLFITIPMVFSKMPMGNVLLALFFLLTAIAATGAMISLLEVPVSYLVDEKNWPRKKAAIVSAVVIALIGSTAALSADSGAILGGITFFGKTFFDLYDYISSNILMPLGGIFIVIFAGWVLGKKVLMSEISNEGMLKNEAFVNTFTFIVKYISPLLIAVVFLNVIGIIKI